MGFLKLTSKVPTAKQQQPIPRAVKKPERAKSIRGLTGLSYEEIETAIEQEYINRGSIILTFQCTDVPNFKLSVDGRFGVRHQEKLRFFQLFIFKNRMKREDFEGKKYDDIKWVESTQLHFYYNEKAVTADMQMREISNTIARYLGAKLQEILEKKREEWFKKEDDNLKKELEAARIGEELLLESEEEEETEDTSQAMLIFNDDRDDDGIHLVI